MEIKGELEAVMEAEPWERGWTKVYETMPLEPYDAVYLDDVAHRLAEIIRVLHPIYRSLRSPNPMPPVQGAPDMASLPAFVRR